MRTAKNLAAIARDRGCNVPRASRPRIAGKMPATRESSSDRRHHTQLPCEESRGGCLGVYADSGAWEVPWVARPKRSCKGHLPLFDTGMKR